MGTKFTNFIDDLPRMLPTVLIHLAKLLTRWNLLMLSWVSFMVFNATFNNISEYYIDIVVGGYMFQVILIELLTM
jgi:hypothetical protein